MQVATQFRIPPPASAAAAGPGPYRLVKRLIDVVCSLLLLVCLAPVLGVCALAVWLDSGGPVLFRQQRIGERGKAFTLLKFRSMHANAGAAPHCEYVAAFIQGRASSQATQQGELFKLADDSRITRVGRWLRRTSLDELPQLWNVLRGDMSLVGPRPPIAYELEYYRPEHLARLGAKPGVTGLWQVSGRSTTTFAEMVALDLQYIQQQSLTLDLLILLKTIPALLASKGA